MRLAAAPTLALALACSSSEPHEVGSPEDLDQGYTHAFLLTFPSEADRAAYLPHPDHVAFTEVVGPHVDAVHVVDYWTRGPGPVPSR